MTAPLDAEFDPSDDVADVTPQQPNYILLSMLLLAVAAAFPLLLNSGFLNTRGGGDSPFLLFRLHELVAALRDGHFPARWMPHAAYGLGYPFYSYYAALALYVAAVFKILGFSYVASLKLTHVAGFVVAAGGMWGWLRAEGRSKAAAWLGALAYTFAPFHLVNVYVRGDSIAEFGAMAVYPLCLWAARRLRQEPTFRQAAWLGAAYGALILSHNISAMIFSPFVLIYIAWHLRAYYVDMLDPKEMLVWAGHANETRGLYVQQCLVGLGIGLALAAFFFAPTLIERELVQLDTVTSGYFHYSQHFRNLDMAQVEPVFNYDIGNPDSTPFAMGLAQLVIAAIGVVAIFFNFDRHNTFVLIGLALSTFMLTVFSEVLWENLPLLEFTQFPWRFLSVQALFTAAATAELWGKRESARAWVINVILVAALALSAMLGLRLDFISITDADVTPTRLQTYEYFTGNIGTTIRYEYLPQWTRPRPYTSGEYVNGEALPIALSGAVSGTRTVLRANYQQWQLNVSEAGTTVALPLLYWPGWVAEVGGQRLDTGPVNGLGWMAFELPPGEHIVTLRLIPTPIRQAAEITSLMTLGVLLLVLFPWRQLAGFRSWPWRRLIFSGLGLVVVLGVARVLAARAEPGGAATMDFAQYGYLHSDIVPFENGTTLLGYNYSTEEIAPGGLLALATVWEGTETTFTVTIVGPSINLLGTGEIFYAATDVSSPHTTTTLEIPQHTPPGVYLLQLTVGANSPALTDSGQTRGTVFLRPFRVLPALPVIETAPIATLTDTLTLQALDAHQLSAGQVTVIPSWQLSQPLAANLATALRLYGPNGEELAAYDGPTGSTINPTYLWPTGQPVSDPYSLELPPGLPPGEYPLTLTLYDVNTLSPVATTDQTIALTHWTNRTADFEATLLGNGELGLADVVIASQPRPGESVVIQPLWATFDQPATATQALWWLGPGPENAMAAATTPLDVANWPLQVLVRDSFTLSIPGETRSNSYPLYVQLLDAAGRPQGDPVNAAVVIVQDLNNGLPVLQSSDEANFTFATDANFNVLRMLGYDIGITLETLSLRLYFQADEPIDRNLKYFVHVFNPNNETIAVQYDAIPGDGNLPTTSWQPGQVVVESVTLPLDYLEPIYGGRVYNIAIGWYDADSGARMLATSGGAQLPFNRFTLAHAIEPQHN